MSVKSAGGGSGILETFQKFRIMNNHKDQLKGIF
jgi:hypothetical protein